MDPVRVSEDSAQDPCVDMRQTKQREADLGQREKWTVGRDIRRRGAASVDTQTGRGREVVKQRQTD